MDNSNCTTPECKFIIPENQNVGTYLCKICEKLVLPPPIPTPEPQQLDTN